MSKHFALLLIVALLLGAQPGSIGEEMSLGTAALTLRAMGFEIDYDMLAEIADEWEIDLERVKAMGVGELLDCMGNGHYNWQTYKWTPISHQVYAFDVEVFDISNMYTLCLQGIQAIVPDVVISDVREDLSGLDDNLEGLRSVSFLCNGHPYSVELESLGDWCNAAFFDFMDRVLEAERCPCRLYRFLGDGQSCIVVYNTEAFARSLEQFDLYLLTPEDGF